MTRKSDKLVIALFKRYVSFVVILGLICLASYIFLGFRLASVLDENSVPLIDIMTGKYIDYNTIDVKSLKALNGEIEIVDRSGDVLKRIGKKISSKDHYTESELLDLVSTKEKNGYKIIINNIKGTEEENYFLVLRIPKDKFEVNLNLLKVPFSVGKPLYKEYGMTIAVTAIFALICIGVYSAWTARKIQKPLEEIDKALMGVIEGDYSNKLYLNGEKEFEGIRDTLNYLIEKLKTSEEENKRLEESKNKLMLDLSHDIKTPMTTIKGYAAALSQNMIEDEEKKSQYYNAIYRKSERVSELMEELFDFVKLENSKIKMNLEKTDLTEFLRQIILEYYDEILDKNIEVKVDIPDDPVIIEIDRKLMRRAINNLIENSIKYNVNATFISVDLIRLDKEIIIRVTDDGVGVPKSIEDTLFDEFVRGDESRQTSGGTGLGLSITKKIILNHNGKIEHINSKNRCIFKITLAIE